MITILGATGHTGSRIATKLLEAKEKVRAFARSRERMKDLAAQGAEVVTGDMTDVAALTAAFQGAKAAYVLIPSDPHAADLRKAQDAAGDAITKALEKANVPRVVFLSSLGAELASGTGPIAGLHAQEQRLRGLADADVLALRAGYFFENAGGTLGLIKHQGINGGAIAPEIAIPMIATRDIADMVVKELRRTDGRGFHVRELLGPRDMTLSEVTAVLGEHLGKPDLKYVQFPYEDLEASLQQMGFSRSVAQQYSEMSRAFNEGRIKSHEGRRAGNTTPTHFEQFARQLEEAYAGV